MSDTHKYTTSIGVKSLWERHSGELLYFNTRHPNGSHNSYWEPLRQTQKHPSNTISCVPAVSLVWTGRDTVRPHQLYIMGLTWTLSNPAWYTKLRVAGSRSYVSPLARCINPFTKTKRFLYSFDVILCGEQFWRWGFCMLHSCFVCLYCNLLRT